MAGITLAQAETMLAAYLDAETAIVSGAQAKTHRGRSLQRAGLEAVQKGVQIWDQKVKELGGTEGDGGIQMRRVVR